MKLVFFNVNKLATIFLFIVTLLINLHAIANSSISITSLTPSKKTKISIKKNLKSKAHPKKFKRVHVQKRTYHHAKIFTKSIFSLHRSNLKNVHITAQSILFSTYATSSSKKQNTIQVSSYTDPRQAINNIQSAFITPFGQIDWPDIAGKIYINNNKYYVNYKGYKLELTIDPKLQEASERDLNQPRIIDGATVIIEPKSGRILTLAQTGGPRNARFSVSARAPAASLIKIVTASAGIEKMKLNPYDEIEYRGNCGGLRDDSWLIDPQRDHQKITLAKAFGASCNPVFARMAIYTVGLSSFKDYAEKFMFNKAIPSDILIQTSMLLLPTPDSAIPQDVGEAGSGFGATKLSPINAALFSAAVQNKGILMAPYIVEAAYDEAGKEIYRAHHIQIGRVIQAATSEKIQILMQATIASGTSRRAFHKRGTRSEISEIGGKTGTLLDPENRDLLYTWFSGIAPIDSPNSIAIAVVTASQQNWVVRATSVAQTTLSEYLKIEKSESSVAIRN